ncbi:MAG: hypothetical protein ABIK68_05240 [bacterium]
MKGVIYEGPSPFARVVADGKEREHVQGEIEMYTDEAADELVKTSDRQRFVYADQNKKRDTETKKAPAVPEPVTRPDPDLDATEDEKPEKDDKKTAGKKSTGKK